MAERYFSPDEVEALIPTLTDLVERLRTAQADLQASSARLDAERQRLMLGGGGLLDRAQWRADTARVESATKDAQAALDQLGALGGVAKGIEEGLVDFPHLRGGRVVNLCWKFGETRIRFWHGLDEGYAARKPL